MAEDMYEVFNMNGMYHHGLASDICIDIPCLPPTFLYIEISPALPLSLFRLQNLLHWASHIPVHHHAEDCLLSYGHSREDSDSPFRISLADLLNASALWATSLTACSYSYYDLYHLDVSISRSPVGFPLSMSSRTLYILPHRTDAQTSHVITSRQ